MEDKDYYAILGVRETASPGEIKRAYRALELQLHPDKLAEGLPPEEAKAAGARLREVREAHYVLGDASRRAAYDAGRRAMREEQARKERDRQRFDALMAIESAHAARDHERALRLAADLHARLPTDVEVAEIHAQMAHEWGVALSNRGDHARAIPFLEHALRLTADGELRRRIDADLKLSREKATPSPPAGEPPGSASVRDGAAPRPRPERGAGAAPPAGAPPATEPTSTPTPRAKPVHRRPGFVAVIVLLAIVTIAGVFAHSTRERVTFEWDFGSIPTPAHQFLREGDVYLRAGDFAHAKAKYLRAAHHGLSAQWRMAILMGAADRLAVAGGLEEAEQVSREASTSAPGSIWAACDHARRLRDLGSHNNDPVMIQQAVDPRCAKLS